MKQGWKAKTVPGVPAGTVTPPVARVGIKKPTQKKPKTHIKQPTKNVFVRVFF
jgi:hypothetical protein